MKKGDDMRFFNTFFLGGRGVVTTQYLSSDQNPGYLLCILYIYDHIWDYTSQLYRDCVQR